jgi:hypothetical protein
LSGKCLRNKTALGVILFVILLASITLCNLKFVSASNVFFDDFNGTAVDNTKWVVQENTNWSGYPAYGGSIKVSESKVHLSSTGSSYPCITSAENPFPSTGDFAIQFDLTYSCISDWGVGFWITKGQFEYKNASSNNNIILQLWAGAIDFNRVSIKGYFLVDDVVKPFAYESIINGWQPSSPTHVFRLEYINGTYSLIDNGVTVASKASQVRPDTIGFGHCPIYWVPISPQNLQSVIGGFGSFNIDYIKVEALGNNNDENGFTDDNAKISLSTNLEQQQIGYKIDLNGKLSLLNDTALSNKQVILWYTIPGISTWYPITSVATDAEGAFNASWIPTATGTFILKAEYTKDQTNQIVSKTVNISVTQVLSSNYLAMESNSTIASAAYNSTTNELFFTLSGPSNTTGYTKICIPKTLANPENMKLLIDNQPIQFNYTSKDDSWLISFNYGHSSHNVILKMGTEPENNSMLIYVAAIAVIIFFTVLILALVKTFHSSKPNNQ